MFFNNLKLLEKYMAIHCTTEDQSSFILGILDAKGYKWNCGNRLYETKFHDYLNCTIYIINNYSRTVYYDHLDEFKNNSYYKDVIFYSFNDFVKNNITKNDLKNLNKNYYNRIRHILYDEERNQPAKVPKDELEEPQMTIL